MNKTLLNNLIYYQWQIHPDNKMGCRKYNGHLVLIVQKFPPSLFKGDRAITPKSALIGSITED